jgi:hypothetical protein
MNLRKNEAEDNETSTSLIEFIRQLPKDNLKLFREVLKIIKLVLVTPASAASVEHSFSGLRWLKTWLRSTMSQTRLTHLAVLHVHQDRIDDNAMKYNNSIFSQFVAKTSECQTLFGHIHDI